MESTYWANDPFWVAAHDAYVEARASGTRQVTLDLDTIEEAVHSTDFAHRLMNAMVSVQQEESMDGFRGASRLVLASVLLLASSR